MRTYIVLAFILLIATFSIIMPYDNPYVQLCPFSLLALLPLLFSAATTAYSVVDQNKAKKNAEREAKKYQNDLEKRRGDYEAWFNSEYKQDFLDTDLGRSTVNQLGQTLKNTLQNQNTSAVRGGMTTEAQVAAQGAAQDTFAQALNQLTGYGTQYKQNLRNSYDYRIQNYLQPLDQLAMNKINAYSGYGAQSGQAYGDLTAALAGYDWNALLGGTYTGGNMYGGGASGGGLLGGASGVGGRIG